MPREIVYKPVEKVKKIFQTSGTYAPPKFMPTYLEWLRRKGERVIQGGSVTVAGTYATYTVPKGYTFFLTNAILGIDDSAVDRINAILLLEGSSGTRKFMSVSAEANTSQHITQNFSPPLELIEGEQILTSFLANALITYSIVGFLVKNSYIPVF